jgi:hypothetical protein
MVKARKFKKKLSQKPLRRKAEPVLSVELIRKETLVKISSFWKQLVSKAKSFKLAK